MATFETITGESVSSGDIISYRCVTLSSYGSPCSVVVRVLTRRKHGESNEKMLRKVFENMNDAQQYMNSILGRVDDGVSKRYVIRPG